MHLSHEQKLRPGFSHFKRKIPFDPIASKDSEHCEIGSGRLAPNPITTLKVPFSAAAEAIFDPSPKIVFHNDRAFSD